MRRVLVLVSTAVFFLVSGLQSLSAQVQGINGRLLPSGVDTFTVSYAGNVIGYGITERSRIEVDGEAHLLQVYTWRGVGSAGVIVDSLYSRESSLRSVREARLVGDTVIEATFGEGEIKLRALVGGRLLGEGALPSALAVYSSAALESLAMAAPLAAGFHSDVQVYYMPPATLGIVSIGIEVKGSATVQDHFGADREAWIVFVNTPDGGTTYWIDQLDRRVLKYDTREGSAVIEFRR